MSRPAESMRALNVEWIRRAAEHEHLFRQQWLGERFFHLAADMVALQQLFWQVKPRTVVMTGIAAAGGPIFAASMLQLAGHEHSGRVIAIDPALRESSRATLATHPLGRRVTIVEGNPVDDAVFGAVAALVNGATDEPRAPVFVILDLIHTHVHVLAELRRYADLVTPGSYIVVLDTIMEELPEDFFRGKPYGKGNNPATAVREFLRTDNDRFEVDRDIEDRALITLAPGGFLRRRAR